MKSLIALLFFASIAMATNPVTPVLITNDSLPVSGTVACSNCSGGGTAGTVAVSNFPASQAVTVTGTIPVSLINQLGTLNIGNFPAVQVTSGTQSISNFPNVQLVAGTMALSSNAATASNQTTANSSLSSIDGKITAVNTGAVVVSSSALPSGAATSAKQDTTISQLGTIANALVLGTIQVSLGSKYVSQTFPASGISSLVLNITGQGATNLAFDVYDPDACVAFAGNNTCQTTDKDFAFFGSIDGISYRQIWCSPSDVLDDQIYGSSNTVYTIPPDGHFRCDASGWNTIVVYATSALKRATAVISVTSGSSIVQQVQSPVLVRPMMGAANFPVQVNAGTLAISGTHAVTVSGTVPVSIPGVVVVSGTTQAAGTQQISGSVSLANIGTMAVSGIVPVSGSLAITTGTVYVNQLTSKWLVTSTEGTTSISNFPQIQPVSGSLAVTTGTIYANQLGTWSDAITGGTIQVVSAVTAITNALPAGTNLLGKTGIDQTTPGSTNGVVVNTGTIFTSQVSLSPVSVSFNESAAAPTAATWYKKRQWQVPSGSTFLPDKAKSTVTTAGSRTFIGTGVVMGSLNLSSNAFSDATAVSAPRYFSRMFGCVTTVMSATSDNLTVTYTDDLGNSHSTAATTFPASTPVGDCIEFPLAATTGQMTDTGFRDVTNITDSAAPTGIVEIIGMNTLHDALGAANAFELSTLDNSVVLQNEFVWILEMQAATTAQQRGAAVEGAIRTP